MPEPPPAVEDARTHAAFRTPQAARSPLRAAFGVARARPRPRAAPLGPDRPRARRRRGLPRLPDLPRLGRRPGRRRPGRGACATSWARSTSSSRPACWPPGAVLVLRPVLPAVRPFRAAAACLLSAAAWGWRPARSASGPAATRRGQGRAGRRRAVRPDVHAAGRRRLAHHRRVPVRGRRAADHRRERGRRAQGDGRLGHPRGAPRAPGRRAGPHRRRAPALPARGARPARGGRGPVGHEGGPARVLVGRRTASRTSTRARRRPVESARRSRRSRSPRPTRSSRCPSRRRPWRTPRSPASPGWPRTRRPTSRA